MKHNKTLDKFGQFLMEKVRDGSLRTFEALVQGKAKSARLVEVQIDLGKLTTEEVELIKRCVALCVDGAIHNLLQGLEESSILDEGIQVIVDGKDIAQESDGLAGELYTSEGWFARYSKYGEPPQVS